MKYKLHFNIRLFEENTLMDNPSINRLKVAIRHIVRTAKKKYDDGSWLYLRQIKSDVDLSDGRNASLYSRDIRMVLSSVDAEFKKDESVEETIKRVKANITKGEYGNEIDVRFVFIPQKDGLLDDDGNFNLYYILDYSDMEYVYDFLSPVLSLLDESGYNYLITWNYINYGDILFSKDSSTSKRTYENTMLFLYDAIELYNKYDFLCFCNYFQKEGKEFSYGIMDWKSGEILRLLREWKSE